MNKKIIAKELVKIAKTLISSNVLTEARSFVNYYKKLYNNDKEKMKIGLTNALQTGENKNKSKLFVNYVWLYYKELFDK